MDSPALLALQRRIGHEFTQPQLLLRSLTHRSWGAEHNERLEFLGDAILDAIIGELLFTTYPDRA